MLNLLVIRNIEMSYLLLNGAVSHEATSCFHGRCSAGWNMYILA